MNIENMEKILRKQNFDKSMIDPKRVSIFVESTRIAVVYHLSHQKTRKEKG